MSTNETTFHPSYNVLTVNNYRPKSSEILKVFYQNVLVYVTTRTSIMLMFDQPGMQLQLII